MTELTCYLECNHTIEWAESPLNPGKPDLPWVGRIVWCSTCEADREIDWITPFQIEITNNNGVRIFYDAYTGTFGRGGEIGFASVTEALGEGVEQ